jgi:pimeloyl-ACP methyl ester carboxylesterase
LFALGTLSTMGLAIPGNSAAAAATTYFVDGIAVHRYRPATPNGKPPIVLVHGGAHAAWVWERYGPFLAGKGWDCHAFDWYNHGQSTSLPKSDFIRRSITDLHREILSVTRTLPAFHLVGHSMGGLASLVSGTLLNPKSLTLINPVVPSQVGATPIPVPVDLAAAFDVPPFEVAKGMFFSTMPDAEAQTYYARLQPESSRAVWEATRWTVPVNLAAVHAPVHVIAAGADTLTPPNWVRALATLVGARYDEFAGIGHSDVLLKSTGWQQVATNVEAWLAAPTG